MARSQKGDPTWSFTVLLDRPATEAEVDAMFEAGLDDCTIGDSHIGVDRAATSMLAAIISVVAQVRSVAGPRPIGLRFDDAVTLSDISQRLNGARTQESLRLLAVGKRGPGGFPRPTVDTGNIRVYSWSQVSTWLRDALGEAVPEANPDLALADAALRLSEWARATNHSDDVRRLLSA